MNLKLKPMERKNVKRQPQKGDKLCIRRTHHRLDEDFEIFICKTNPINYLNTIIITDESVNYYCWDFELIQGTMPQEMTPEKYAQERLRVKQNKLRRKGII